MGSWNLEVLAYFNIYHSQSLYFSALPPRTGSIAKSAVSNHIGYAGV